MSKQPIDVILTSCGRFELLEQTLDSFFKYVDWPINNFFIYEDRGIENYTEDDKAWAEYLSDKYESIIWFFGRKRTGQIKALDFLTERVTTEYYLQGEDDFIFCKEGFIEQSLSILEKYPNINQVQLRGTGNVNGHPEVNITFESGCKEPIKVLQRGYKGMWFGFGFNPSVRRLKDYKLIGSYGEHAVFKPTAPWESEASIGRLYKNLGFYTSILDDTYCIHIGDNHGIRK